MEILFDIILWQIAWKYNNFKSNKKLLTTAFTRNWGIGCMVSICKRNHNCVKLTEREFLFSD